jgi:hypothetical protein
VDPETVDQNYAQLQQQAQQTAAQIQTLAGKLQAAAAGGDPNAREWLLGLKEITLGVQQEQAQVSQLLQSIHSMVNNHVESMAQPGFQQPGFQQPGFQQPGFQQPGYQEPGYQEPGYQPGYQQSQYQPGYQPQYQQGPAGMLQQFLGGGFGRSMSGGGRFGIGEDIIRSIF